MSHVYYNEIDPKAAAWLRELIKRGNIAPGDVDERSIEDVTPNDLRGYVQCHFFAGIGIWSHALRLAGWPDDKPIWTGSCPCQPFSAAGKGRGFDDERHLWPAFHWLIKQCRPRVVLGEQVAHKAGAAWFDIVSNDLEGENYAVGTSVSPACGFGAPHLRQRQYWVAHSEHIGRAAGSNAESVKTGGATQSQQSGGLDELANDERERLGRGPNPSEQEGRAPAKLSGRLGELAQPDSQRLDGERLLQRQDQAGRDEGDILEAPRGGESSELAHPGGQGLPKQRGGREQPKGSTSANSTSELADSSSQSGKRIARAIPSAETQVDRERIEDGGDDHGYPDGGQAGHPGPTNGHWRSADWLLCRDDKWRPVRPGSFPLVDGAPSELVPSGDLSESDVESTKEARVMRLKGYGNGIVATQAQAFIEVVAEIIS